MSKLWVFEKRGDNQVMTHIIVSRTLNLGNFNSKRIEHKHNYDQDFVKPFDAYLEAEVELAKMVDHFKRYNKVFP